MSGERPSRELDESIYKKRNPNIEDDVEIHEKENREAPRSEEAVETPKERESGGSEQMAESIRVLWEYLQTTVFAERKDDELVSKDEALANFEQKIIEILGANSRDIRAVSTVREAIEETYTLCLANDAENSAPPRQKSAGGQFRLELGELFQFALTVLGEEPEAGKEKVGPREILNKIQQWAVEKKIAMLARDDEEEGQEEKTADEDDEALYDDDDEITEESSIVAPEITESEPQDEGLIEHEDREVAAVDEVLLKKREVVWEDSMTAVTTEPQQEKRWERMLVSKIIRGTLRRNARGQSVLQIDFQPTPWFVEGRKEFVKKNKKYDELFPGAFERIRDPRRDGGYLPEDIFFEPTGKAMAMFLKGRWDEYIDTDEYRFYKKRQEEVG